ncbi:tyrosine-type recombinase/integrase [Xenophilus aerolatus]|nr:integrase arm-type DNA-binding domain-containing protein [Xenophilus aerolatus]
MPRNLITSDLTLRSIKLGDSRRRISDGDGLYILLFVKGGAHGWRFDYTFAGRRKTLSLGTYPTVGLALARSKAQDARKLVAEGFDPSAQRKALRASHEAAREADALRAAGQPAPDTFEHVAREWFALRKAEWAETYASKVIARLEASVFPHIGARPVAEVAAPELVAILRRIEERGLIETAHRVHVSIGQVFRYAIATGRALSNPARDLKDVLKKAVVSHFPAITDPKRFGELLRASDGYRGTPVVRTALRLAPLVFVRPGELRKARWEEFDLDARLWTIPAARMKRKREGKLNGEPHLVPLSTQAVAVLRELHPLTGASPYVFRGERHHDRPMSDAAVNAALRAMGFGSDEVVGHGFRASARTIMVEHLDVDADVVEAQLAHAVKDALGRAYNRTEFRVKRARMMQQWADYLDGLKNEGARVSPN